MMFTRWRWTIAPLLLALALVACGTPSGTATTGTNTGSGGAGASPGGSPIPGGAHGATPTLPAGQHPPRPSPDPAAVAAGAPLRATLLAQIDAYAQAVAKCQSTGTPVVSCNTTAFEQVRPQSPELEAYMGWLSTIKQCSSDGKGGFIATMMYIYSSPDELREPGLLDVYVSGTSWCGLTGPTGTPSARPSGAPATPVTPVVPAGQRPPQPTPDRAAVAAGAPLRATLLAQLDAFERTCAATPVTGGQPCRVTPGAFGLPAELSAYAGWYSSISQCSSDGKGGYVFTAMLRTSSPAELRDAALLDLYVANTPWCGLTGSATVTPSARPAPASSRPSTVPAPVPPSPPSLPPAPSTTPTIAVGQRVPPPSPDPAAVAAGAPLRATLLKQIDTLEQTTAPCTSTEINCRLAAIRAQAATSPELVHYADWYTAVELCVGDGQGGFRAQARAYVPTTAELRDPAHLDLYVANAPWCGWTGNATTPQAPPITPTPNASSMPPQVTAMPIPSGTGRITELVTARTVGADKRPGQQATEFTTGETVYIAYTITDLSPDNYIDLKMYRTSVAVNLQGTAIRLDQSGTYFGYYSYTPSQVGEYRIDLFLNGKSTPDQSVTFTVR